MMMMKLKVLNLKMIVIKNKILFLPLLKILQTNSNLINKAWMNNSNKQMIPKLKNKLKKLRSLKKN